MSENSVLIERDEHIAIVTLNRPQRHNAFDFPMISRLEQLWRELAEDDQVRCVIVTGAGDRAFCSGMDLGSVAADEKSAAAATELSLDQSPVLRLTALQNTCWKPVITAVNGLVCGGGLHFIADSDLVIADEHATFFDNHVAMGLVAGLEPVGLTRRIPLESVFRLALLGGAERMSADEALRLGLVGEVLPAGRLMERAIELGRLISRHSPTALMRTKQAIWQSLDHNLHDGLENAWRLIAEHQSHPDATEGAHAFSEKRQPAWGKAPDTLKNQGAA